MPSAQEINDKYQALHDDLSEAYYTGDKTDVEKATFDQAHGQLWIDYEAEMVAEGHHKLPGPTVEERLDTIEARIGP